MYYSYIEIEYVARSFSPTRTDLAVKLLMPLDGLKRSIWMSSGEKQQGETMALFLGPVVGQVVRLPMLSLATSPICFTEA
jgi:hypothetical protein